MELTKITSGFKEMLYIDDNDLVLTIFWNSLYTAFFLLPLGINLPTPFFIISIVLGLINIFRSRKKHFSNDKALLLFPLYFIIMAFSLIYSDNISAGFDLLQRSLSLLFFPVIFLFVKEDASTVKKLIEFLLIGLLVSFFINLTVACYNVFSIIKDDFSFFELSLEGFNLLLNSLSDGWNYFIGAEFSGLVNPSYVSLYILLVLSYYLKNKILSRTRLLITLVLFLYLFLLASIAAYLTLFIISILLIFNIPDKNQKYTMIIVFILGLIVFLQNPRVFDFYTNVTDTAETLEIDNTSVEKSRLLTWDASVKLIEEAPILGYGIGDTNDVLIEKYKELNYISNYQNKYNAHNQFLQTFLQTGIFGFGVLVNIFVLLAIRMNRSRNEVAVYVILFISLFFESMLVRFNGIVFFSIIIPLLLKKRSILSSRIIRNE
ncbi:O-antigen ligase family protein [Aquimarina gracilis]|uniref:O-antigen ligase family protein n=1 Tax=Aquimarina gracilis TaxID=874422 RepID=A0ABU6A0V9_9FLAO|nr:O-antigen ligase family protein [Aquimarina gracilis]MEB3347736.1 O-antigen ligase family protein [Aquimarina gracilis]